jgi:hypothetical protein
MAHRRSPPPWSIEDIGAAFVVIDNIIGEWLQTKARFLA